MYGENQQHKSTNLESMGNLQRVSNVSMGTKLVHPQDRWHRTKTMASAQRTHSALNLAGKNQRRRTTKPIGLLPLRQQLLPAFFLLLAQWSSCCCRRLVSNRCRELSFAFAVVDRESAVYKLTNLTSSSSSATTTNQSLGHYFLISLNPDLDFQVDVGRLDNIAAAAINSNDSSLPGG